MMIDTPAAAREYTQSWTSQASLTRATRMVGIAHEGLTRALKIELSQGHRLAADATRETRRALVAELLHAEITTAI